MRDDMILCQQKVAEVLAQVNQIVIGKEECVRKVMAAIDCSSRRMSCHPIY